MNFCNECGQVFSDEEMIQERDETKALIDEPRCPHCGSDFFSTAQRCKVCGEWTDDDYCPDCKDDMMNDLFRLFHEYQQGNKNMDLMDFLGLAEVTMTERMHDKAVEMRHNERNE